MYKIPPAPEESDDRIAEMRMKWIREENKRVEERRQDEMAKRKFQDRQLLKVKEKGVVMGTFASYTLAGKPVDVQLLTQFVNIAPKCKQTVATAEENSVGLRPRVSYLGVVPRLANRRKGLPSLEEMFAQESATIEQEKPPVDLVLPRVYEAFVPSVGVTFTEHGKKMKGGQETVGGQLGRIGRAEFNTMISQMTRVPSFLPELVSKTEPSIFSIAKQE